MVAASECSQDLVTDRAGIGGRRIDAVSRLEDQTNEMLYRREVEFSRGHGTSVAWELAEGRLD